MLKIYRVNKENILEIFPLNSVYNVHELGKYRIVYSSHNFVAKNVFLEDIPIAFDKISQNENQMILSEFRYFENYFGFATLKINNEFFLFNIKIEKLSIPPTKCIPYNIK